MLIVIAGLLLLSSLLLVSLSRRAAPTTTMIYSILSDGGVVALKASNNHSTLLWTFQSQGDHFDSISTVSNGVLYVISSNQYVYAIPPNGKKFLWRERVGSDASDPIVVNNIVYVLLDHAVVAYKASDGSLLRLYQVGNDNTFLPQAMTVANGIVYVTTNDYVQPPSAAQCQPFGCSGTTGTGGSLYAFKASDGSLLWHQHTTHEGYIAQVIVNNVVYAADGTSITAWQGNNGKLLWQVPAQLYGKTLQVANNVVCCSNRYVGSNHFVSALATSDGHTLWQYPIPYMVPLFIPSVTMLDNVIYITTTQAPYKNLYAIQADTGKLLWLFPKAGIINCYVHVVDNGIAYFASRDDGNANDFIDALRVKDGTVVWSRRTTGLTDPVEVGGILYTGVENPTLDHHIYAIRASDGTLVWQYQAEANAFRVQAFTE